MHLCTIKIIQKKLMQKSRSRKSKKRGQSEFGEWHSFIFRYRHILLRSTHLLDACRVRCAMLVEL